MKHSAETRLRNHIAGFWSPERANQPHYLMILPSTGAIYDVGNGGDILGANTRILNHHLQNLGCKTELYLVHGVMSEMGLKSPGSKFGFEQLLERELEQPIRSFLNGLYREEMKSYPAVMPYFRKYYDHEKLPIPLMKARGDEYIAAIVHTMREQGSRFYTPENSLFVSLSKEPARVAERYYPEMILPLSPSELYVIQRQLTGQSTPPLPQNSLAQLFLDGVMQMEGKFPPSEVTAPGRQGGDHAMKNTRHTQQHRPPHREQ